MLGTLFRSLSSNVRLTIAPKKEKRRAPSAYNKFMKKHYHSVRGTPIQRLNKLTARYKARKAK